MKHLVYKLVVPLTVISFSFFTKWWYALPVDAPDTMFTGFPLPYVCRGWHTSLSLQIFWFELCIDLFAYFSFWFILIFCINKFIRPIRIHKILAILLLSLSGLFTAVLILFACNPDNIHYYKRPFKMEVMETGFQCPWCENTRPDIYKYHPERKNN